MLVYKKQIEMAMAFFTFDSRLFIENKWDEMADTPAYCLTNPAF